MSFDIKTASVLTGLTTYQLRHWAKQEVFTPENVEGYSFRDIVAGRTLAFLRANFSAQKIKEAVRTLRVLDPADHFSEYTLGHDGKVILLRDANGQIVEISHKPGQTRAFTFKEVWKPFKNFKNENVPALDRPREELRTNENRLGGWPTVGETRIGFDVIAGFIDGKTITINNIGHYYPSVTPKAASDALSLMEAVKSA